VVDADEVRDGARGRVHNDEAGRPVAVTGRIIDTGYWTDHRIAAIPVLNAAARELAPRLVGLTKSRAQALVDEHEGITVEFRDAGATQEALYAVVGGTFAYLRDGRVVRVN
jgi:hypothetical protein